MTVFKLANKTFSRVWRRSKDYTEAEIRMLSRKRGMLFTKNRDSILVKDKKGNTVATFQEVRKNAAEPISERSRNLAAIRVAVAALLLLCTALSAQTYQEKVVAAVIMGEASIEGARGMYAVAEVINRRSQISHKTPYQIVTASRGRIHAFSCMNGTTPERMVQKFQTWDSWPIAIQIAHVTCTAPNRLPNYTNRATHFTRKTERPWWARGKRIVAVVGNHAFYRLDFK